MSRQHWKDSQRKSADATKEMQREFDNMWEQKLSLKKILYAHNISVDKCGGCSQYFEAEPVHDPFDNVGPFLCESCQSEIPDLVDADE